MEKANLKELVINENFVELDEKCLMATEGGCGGGGSITEGIRFKMKGGWVYW